MPFIALVYVDDHTADAIESGDAPWEGSAATVGLFRWPERKDIGCTGHVGWARDPMGWMKCAICGKRNKRIRRFFINALFDHFGANHYPQAPAAFRTPEGYGPVREQ
jgi:hypothetical protein